MSGRIVLLLTCVVANVGCSLSGPVEPALAEANLAAITPDIANDAPVAAKMTRNRRLKSFHLNFSTNDLVDYRYDLEYTPDGTIKKLVVAGDAESGIAPTTVLSYRYSNSVLSRLVRRLLMEKS